MHNLKLLIIKPETIGKTLRTIRCVQDLQKQHIIQATNRTLNTVTSWERSETGDIKFSDLSAYLDCLGYEVVIREKTNG